MKKDKLKLIFILMLAVLLFSCSKEAKEPAEEQKPVEAKVETSTKTESQSKETQAKEEKTEKEKDITPYHCHQAKTAAPHPKM